VRRAGRRTLGAVSTDDSRSDDGRAPGSRPEEVSAQVCHLRLRYEEPYDHAQIFGFLQRRAIPGVEEVTGDAGRRTYRRTLRLPCGAGVAEVDERPGGDGSVAWLDCRLRLTDPRGPAAAEQLLRRQFDLDADPRSVARLLGADGVLGPHVAAAPGLRAPGTVDPHELAVRAVLGQQITVAAARTLAARLVATHGEPLSAPDGGLTRLFPEPAALASASLAELGMPESRRATIRTVAAALADGTVVLDPGADRDEAERSLLALRGVGPWTAGYVRMRALGDPDVFLPGDVGVRHGLDRVGADAGRAEFWRPWRTYALHHLWHLAAAPGGTAG
jgi:AraC family transcriptional regulator of adaptative response / DNA-3-methyladenine glycosylase II